MSQLSFNQEHLLDSKDEERAGEPGSDLLRVHSTSLVHKLQSVTQASLLFSALRNNLSSSSDELKKAQNHAGGEAEDRTQARSSASR